MFKKKVRYEITKAEIVKLIVLALLLTSVIIYFINFLLVHKYKPAINEWRQTQSVDESAVKFFCLDSENKFFCFRTDGYAVKFYENTEPLSETKKWVKEGLRDFNNGERTEKALLAAFYTYETRIGHILVKHDRNVFCALVDSYLNGDYSEEDRQALREQIYLFSKQVEKLYLTRLAELNN